MTKHLPNFITCLNLITGTIGIYSILMGTEMKAIYFVLIGGVFDLLDGLIARVLKVNSDFGKQLDSLADLVTFGLVPSFYVLTLLQQQTEYFWVALFITVFSALRLAKFNLDESQSTGFKGLPTPANAIMLTSLSFILFELTAAVLVGIVVLSCVLLVSRIPLLALKFETLRWKGNEFRWVLIFAVLGFAIVFGWTFVPFIVPLYLTISALSCMKKSESE